jgi:hypothetical protein
MSFDILQPECGVATGIVDYIVLDCREKTQILSCMSSGQILKVLGRGLYLYGRQAVRPQISTPPRLSHV